MVAREAERDGGAGSGVRGGPPDGGVPAGGVPPGGDPPAGARPSNAPVDPEADAWLVGRARTGDGDALEVLIRRHRTRAYRIALRIVGNEQDAEDITQDVFLHVIAALAGFLGDSAFSTWLYRIVVNRALNHRQRHRTSSPLDDLPAAAVPVERDGTEDTVVARHRIGATARAVADLPDDQRAAFVLHHMEGLSYREVAAILDISEATVRGRLARARLTLLDRLREWA